jgi:hypothetical protein
MSLTEQQRYHLLRPLVDQRVAVQGRVVNAFWHYPPKGGQYRSVDIEIYRFEPSTTEAAVVHRDLERHDAYPVMLQCRLPRSLELDVGTTKLGPVKPPIEVYLQVRIRGLRGYTGVTPGVLTGSRPRTPGLKPEDDPTPNLDPMAREFNRLARSDRSETASPPDAEERYARSATTFHRPDPVDLEWLQSLSDEQTAEVLERLKKGETVADIRQEKENGQ